MRVLINGLPHFSKKIAADLNAFDSENHYKFYNTYYSKWDFLRFALALPFSRAVISFNGVSNKSKSLDLVVKWRKKMVMQWHGTDVLLAVQRHANSTINRTYIDYADHLVSAPWFLEELKGIVPDMTYAPFGYVTETGNNTVYEKIRVLTYIPAGNESFYGWPLIKELARLNPTLTITVLGNKDIENSPENVCFVGWLNESEMMDAFSKHAIFIRLTDHDGKAITVSQALAKGCEVIWTHPYDQCHLVNKDLEELVETFHKVKGIISKRSMRPNSDNIAFAQRSLLKDQVMRNFVKIIKKTIEK